MDAPNLREVLKILFFIKIAPKLKIRTQNLSVNRMRSTTVNNNKRSVKLVSTETSGFILFRNRKLYDVTRKQVFFQTIIKKLV